MGTGSVKSLQYSPSACTAPSGAAASIDDKVQWIKLHADAVFHAAAVCCLQFLTQYFTSQCSIAECLMYDSSQPTKVHLIPRPKGAAAGSKPYILEAPPMFTFHHANAFQVPASSADLNNSSGNGCSKKQQFVLDTVAWDNVAFEANQYTITPDYYKGGNRAQLRRFVFDLDPAQPLNSSTSSTGRLVGNFQLARRCMEFPSVNWDVHGLPHRHMYCSADTVDHELYWGPTQAVMKLSLPDPLAGTQV